MPTLDPTWTKPNFFLVGAPKCGTTSLSEYLRRHPGVRLSEPKEPGYFNVDHATAFRFAITEDDYRSCFRNVDDSAVSVGDASAWYIESSEAVRRILAFNPEARFVAMVRNPVDMVHSLHAQLVFTVDEDETDFERAWRLQEARRENRDLPARCREPKTVQYGEVGKLGEHVERLFDLVPRDRVHVIVMDDLRNDPDGTFRSVLSFLGLEPISLPSYHVANPSKTIRVPAIQRLLRAGVELKRTLGLKRSLGVSSLVTAANTRPRRRAPLTEAFRTELRDFYRDDVRKLSDLLERDLTGWTDG